MIVLLREMKKKKQQNNSDNSELSEEKQKETETEPQPPAAPNSHKAAPAPQPIKRGQKVGREQGRPWAELLAWKYRQESQLSQISMAAWWFEARGGFRMMVVGVSTGTSPLVAGELL